MSDETEMNPDLESFAANLRNVPAPDASIDRDQLMYDAGWAAAMTNATVVRESTVTATPRNGISQLILSFAGGVAIATAVLLSIVPLPNGASAEPTDVAAATTPNTGTKIASMPLDSSEDVHSMPADLMKWIDNLPPGHSFASGFSSRPVSPNLGLTKVSLTRPVNKRLREPTTQALMQELMPRQRTQKVIPDWTSWLTPGA